MSDADFSKITWDEISKFMDSVLPKNPAPVWIPSVKRNRGIRGRRKRVVAEISRRLKVPRRIANAITARNWGGFYPYP